MSSARNLLSSRSKKLVKECIKRKSFNDLLRKKESHSKMTNLVYDDLKLQNYLKSDANITNEEKYLLFKLRTRMTEMKSNFKNRYIDYLCLLCGNELDQQIHLMNCDILIENCSPLSNNTEIEYEDIFGTKDKQKMAIKLIMKIWKTREKLLNKTKDKND